MMSITLPSMVAVMLCFELIIIRHSFNACKNRLYIQTQKTIQLHIQNFMQANNNWMTGRSLDTPDLSDRICLFQSLSLYLFVRLQRHSLYCMHRLQSNSLSFDLIHFPNNVLSWLSINCHRILFGGKFVADVSVRAILQLQLT